MVFQLIYGGYWAMLLLTVLFGWSLLKLAREPGPAGESWRSRPRWPAVLIIGLACSAHQAWSANLYTTVSDMFPKRAIASVVGIGGMAGSAGGILFPLFAGKLLDIFADNPTTAYAILFAICGSAYIIAFGIHHLLAPRFEQIAIPESLEPA